MQFFFLAVQSLDFDLQVKLFTVVFAIIYANFSNAVGPLVGLWLVFKNGHALRDSGYDISMLYLILFGALSMIIGLWILGHKVISTIGTKITLVTPPR